MNYRQERSLEKHDSSVPELELTKTRLQVINGELLRLNSEGNPLLRVPLDQIEDVHYLRRFDPTVIAFLLMGAGVSAIGYYISENNVVSCLLYVVGIAALGLSLLGFIRHEIRLQSRGGVTAVRCEDAPDEGENFVMSLRALLK